MNSSATLDIVTGNMLTTGNGINETVTPPYDYDDNETSSSDVIMGWPTIDAIDRFVTPVWYVIGIPGNLIAYGVWIQRRMRPSSGCYLAALAMDECIFLILQVDHAHLAGSLI